MPEPIDNSNDCVPCIFGTCFSKENGILGPKNFFACGAPKGACGAGGAKTPTPSGITYGTPPSGSAGANRHSAQKFSTESQFCELCCSGNNIWYILPT